jgi:hypothetical protein
MIVSPDVAAPQHVEEGGTMAASPQCSVCRGNNRARTDPVLELRNRTGVKVAYNTGIEDWN